MTRAERGRQRDHVTDYRCRAISYILAMPRNRLQYSSIVCKKVTIGFIVQGSPVDTDRYGLKPFAMSAQCRRDDSDVQLLK